MRRRSKKIRKLRRENPWRVVHSISRKLLSVLWGIFLVYQQGADVGGTLAIGAVIQQQQKKENAEK